MSAGVGVGTARALFPVVRLRVVLRLSVVVVVVPFIVVVVVVSAVHAARHAAPLVVMLLVIAAPLLPFRVMSTAVVLA